MESARYRHTCWRRRPAWQRAGVLDLLLADPGERRINGCIFLIDGPANTSPALGKNRAKYKNPLSLSDSCAGYRLDKSSK
jgi:hypothetical protein